MCLLLLPARTVSAEGENLVSGQFGVVFAYRNNLEELGAQYRSGALFGLHAGVELNLDDSPWSVGLGLTTLVRGYYFASNENAVDQTVEITEMSMGLRLRRTLPGSRHHVVGTFGGGFTASNVPLPPAFNRRTVGLYGGLGYDRRLAGEWTWGLEARYASYLDGPSNLSLLGTFTAGFGK
jgi:hypothetical protein